MKKVINYISDDGQIFNTEAECREYEANLRSENMKSVQEVLCELDEKLWNKYYPGEYSEEKKPALYVADIWLRFDIVHVLCDEKFNSEDVKKDILTMIKETSYSETILKNYVFMDEIMKEVSIRKDWETALKSVKEGRDLSNKIHYAIGKDDLKKLAKLHKANKCRKKIESLLTDCNFHYECEKFIKKDYSEYI